jgi:hypothetical protein
VGKAAGLKVAYLASKTSKQKCGEISIFGQEEKDFQPSFLFLSSSFRPYGLGCFPSFHEKKTQPVSCKVESQGDAERRMSLLIKKTCRGEPISANSLRLCPSLECGLLLDLSALLDGVVLVENALGTELLILLLGKPELVRAGRAAHDLA